MILIYYNTQMRYRKNKWTRLLVITMRGDQAKSLIQAILWYLRHDIHLNLITSYVRDCRDTILNRINST